MKRLISLCLLVCMALPSCSQAKKNQESDQTEVESSTTKYYLIRHAEKVRKNNGDADPHLTKEGKLRAKRWANEVFKNVKFDAVYSTDYHRTRNTATPTAKKNGLKIKFYDPMNMDMEAFKNETKGQTVLIVGHSNTTPMLVNKMLGEQTYDEIDDAEFGTLFTVSFKDAEPTVEMEVIY